MLIRLERLQNLGVFVDHVSAGEPDLGRVTIIYGDNGSGKSTLSAALDSLRSADSDLVSGRRTLGAADGPRILLSSDDGQLAYDGHQWNAAMFRLEVFHRGFVDRNVFTGHLVTNAHKQNLCEFVLGGRSVTLSKKIAELGTLALRLSKEIASVKGALQTHVEGSMTIGQFVRLPSVPEIDKQLLQAERDSAAVLKIQELDKRARPVTPPAVAFDADAFRGFLSADLRGISIESMKLVRTHVESVLDKTEGQRWLRYGLAHVVDGLCPYCCQDLSASTIADAYVDFFGDAFRKHLVSLRAQEAAFLQVIGDQAPLQSLRAISEGREKALLWAKECELDEDALANPLQELESRWSEATAVLHAAVVGKMENPVDRFEPTEEIDNAMLELADVLSEYEGARRTVLEAGRSIEARMTALKAMREDEVDQRLSKLRNTKRRHSTTVDALCTRLRRLEKGKDRVDKSKDSARAQVNANMDRLLTQYKDDINAYLETLGTKIQIVGQRVDHHTKQPKVEYKLEIAGHEIGLGDEKTAPDEPCLRNTLSDGDKNSLAFAFFLAHLKRRDLAQTIVVVDDPVNSMDRHRRGQTCNEIARLARTCRQVIVLTHEPRLARSLWKATPTDQLTTLSITRIRDTNTLVPWDIERGTADRYFRGHFDLCQYAENGGDPGAAMRQVRQLLEGYLRRRLPGHWSEKQWLGQMLRTIREANPGDTVAELQGSFYDELSDINELTKAFHHDDASGTEDDVELDDASALPIVRRALALVGTRT